MRIFLVVTVFSWTLGFVSAANPGAVDSTRKRRDVADALPSFYQEGSTGNGQNSILYRILGFRPDDPGPEGPVSAYYETINKKQSAKPNQSTPLVQDSSFKPNQENPVQIFMKHFYGPVHDKQVIPPLMGENLMRVPEQQNQYINNPLWNQDLYPPISFNQIENVYAKRIPDPLFRPPPINQVYPSYPDNQMLGQYYPQREFPNVLADAWMYYPIQTGYIYPPPMIPTLNSAEQNQYSANFPFLAQPSSPVNTYPYQDDRSWNTNPIIPWILNPENQLMRLIHPATGYSVNQYYPQENSKEPPFPQMPIPYYQSPVQSIYPRIEGQYYSVFNDQEGQFKN